jgi:hypothetical protein
VFACPLHHKDGQGIHCKRCNYIYTPLGKSSNIQHLENQVKVIEGEIAAFQFENQNDFSSSVVSQNHSSVVVQKVEASVRMVWSLVRCFD